MLIAQCLNSHLAAKLESLFLPLAPDSLILLENMYVIAV